MVEPNKIQPIFRKTLIRAYYFAEAIAVYELYYQPLIDTYRPARQELKDAGRHEDRPPTWVPLVFHCTTLSEIGRIFQDGQLRPGKNGTVAFTEIPIGELDRMKYRHHAEGQIAIGFPRQYIQSLGLTPVWYLKHNPELVAALGSWKTSDPDGFGKVKPFIDENEDVAPFQEVRSTVPVDIGEAVWLLTTSLDSEKRPAIPEIDAFTTRHGKISRSFWHRSHQMEMLSEWQFVKITKDVEGVPTALEFLGEHYWRRFIAEERELSVTLPAHTRKLTFEISDFAKQRGFEGPWRFIDVARVIARLLLEPGNDVNSNLPYRLIGDITQI